MQFQLHPNLEKKLFVADLPLCRVLLENNVHYPWIFLIPRKPNIQRIMDLNPCDQLQLIKELDLAQKILWNEYRPTQLNLAAIGNKTPQLHIHIIARFETDPAWPNTVWDHPLNTPYTQNQQQQILTHLSALFENGLIDSLSDGREFSPTQTETKKRTTN